jgi:trimeric autotransporter adhesin
MVAAAPPAAETSDGLPVLSPATTPAQSLALSAGIEADLIDEVEIIPLPSAEGEGPTAATPTGAADAPTTDVDAAGFADATPAPAKRKLMASADDSLPPARIKPRHSAPAQLASLEIVASKLHASVVPAVTTATAAATAATAATAAAATATAAAAAAAATVVVTAAAPAAAIAAPLSSSDLSPPFYFTGRATATAAATAASAATAVEAGTAAAAAAAAAFSRPTVAVTARVAPPAAPAALEDRWNDHWKAKAKATAAPSPAQLAQLPSPSPAATAANGSGGSGHVLSISLPTSLPVSQPSAPTEEWGAQGEEHGRALQALAPWSA